MSTKGKVKRSRVAHQARSTKNRVRTLGRELMRTQVELARLRAESTSAHNGLIGLLLEKGVLEATDLHPTKEEPPCETTED